MILTARIDTHPKPDDKRTNWWVGEELATFARWFRDRSKQRDVLRLQVSWPLWQKIVRAARDGAHSFSVRYDETIRCRESDVELLEPNACPPSS